ncbi:E3 ubiquitin-protein ligase TRIM39-like isoform X2 [Gopherus flavomarginatus]|uniref:E3 ubiquitin-protein ligase TRIM39-like isoform X2 n=1 Tax=Gopherus flavomarginatus TaxID=286002 RepID=UPI0021CC4295|nr:E3 ubiquitin-protein ligase TRIM39-like isoform X2 [Gopherus flavomarginatus]
MAFVNPLEKLQEEAICSICLEYMSDPVSIDCGHNFCRACITTYCQDKGFGARGPMSCPQCRAAFCKSNIRPNRQLANIVETIKQLGLPPAKRQPEALCRKHEEKLKLFCEEDGEAICVVCRESLEHRPHTVYPIEEAAQVYKEIVKKKRERIVIEFGKLHQLLAEEEKLLLQKLEQEEKIILQRINENLTRLLELRSSLDKLILEIREKFQQSADGLLKDTKSTLSRCEAVTFQAPEACSVALKENYSIPEHCLGMRNMLKKFKEDVTLDPETAHLELILSDDRKSVRRGGKKLSLSLFDNPKRFNASPLVLGVQAFSTGRRYWEVQVGDKTEWGLGLCRESASRKGTVVLSPQNGYWVLRLQSGGKYEALTSPLTSLHLSVRPRRVGIFLDYEAGDITFYNVTDRDHIYTFTDQFSGPLRPLFFPGASAGGKNAEPLVISWVRDTEGSGCILL